MYPTKEMKRCEKIGKTNLIGIRWYRFKACKGVVEKNKISFTGKLKAKPVVSDGIKPTFHSSVGLRHSHFSIQSPFFLSFKFYQTIQKLIYYKTHLPLENASSFP